MNDAMPAIHKLRSSKRETVRPVVSKLEKMLLLPLTVLDKGFVRVVDYMGDQSAIVQAARISFGRGTKSKSEDAALIRYLLKNGHTSPFEMCEIKLHVRLPIFVARQWVRHRTANINEQSARYSILKNEFYVPPASALAEQSRFNRQGRSASSLPVAEASSVLEVLTSDAERAFQSYNWLLNETPEGTPRDSKRSRLSRELARIGLPLSTYTEWYWKIDLHNLLNFIRLRASPHAQHEIRAYAETIASVVQAWVPEVYSAFQQFQLNSVTLSPDALRVVQNWVAGRRIAKDEKSLSKSERQQLEELFRPRK